MTDPTPPYAVFETEVHPSADYGIVASKLVNRGAKVSAQPGNESILLATCDTAEDAREVEKYLMASTSRFEQPSIKSYFQRLDTLG